MFKEIMTKLDNHRIRNARMLTVAATLFFAEAVFKITADKWPEGIIYFIAAACFVSLEKAYTGRDKKNCEKSEKTDHDPDNGIDHEIE